MKKLLLYLFLINLAFFLCAEKEEKESEKLEGTPISSDGESDSLKNAFNKDLTKEFKSTSPSNGWVGLELESPHRITKIGWGQKSQNKLTYLLGIFEGANEPSFIDAIPLYMITKEGKKGEMNYVDIDVNYSFKYVRYVGPWNNYTVISGLEFFGYEAPTKLEEDEEHLYQPTNLPLVIIHTENQTEPTDKEDVIQSRVVIIDGGKRDTKGDATFRYRGNGSLHFAKKPYKIKFDSKTKILDFPSKAKNWGLISNGSDKTLIRNAIAYKISRILEMPYTAECRPVDFMLNGEYKGSYNLCDKIEVGKNRLELEEIDETCNEEPEITGGYLIEANGYAREDDVYGQTPKGMTYSIKYPDVNDITIEQLDYLEKTINKYEEEVNSGIVDNIDADSLINFILVNEISANPDALWSVYMYKERNDPKLYFGPVWDFDIAFGNDGRSYPISNQKNFVFKSGFGMGTTSFITKIFTDEEILQKLKDKWEEVTKTKITKEVLYDFIDEQSELIKESRELNFIRWGDALMRKIGTNPVVWCTFEAEMKYLKDFIDERLPQLDKIMANATVESIGSGNNGGWGGWGGWGGNNNRNNTQGGNNGGWGGWGGWGGNNNRNNTQRGNNGGWGGNNRNNTRPENVKWYIRDPLGLFDETCITKIQDEKNIVKEEEEE